VIRRLLFLTATVLLPSRLAAAVVQDGQPVMGTVLQVTVIAPDQALARRLADSAFAVARRWDDVLTVWRPDGELARLNGQAGRGPIHVSASLWAALRAMRTHFDATGGAFDPAVGPLVRAWITPGALAVRPRAHTPLPQALALAPGTADLTAGAALDPGGIGKGLALDAMADVLRRGGATAAFLDFGGSSQLALGAPPGAPDGWVVAVAGLGRGMVHGTVHLRDAALSTSRASGAGDSAGPIVDPRSRAPVEAPRLATVLARDAASADAWSTALVVLGRAGLPRAEAAGLAALVEDAQGRVLGGGFPLRRSGRCDASDGSDSSGVRRFDPRPVAGRRPAGVRAVSR
jgi:thiamine biosynthesis lipoprotein